MNSTIDNIKIGKKLWKKIQELLDARIECDYAQDFASDERVSETSKEYNKIEIDVCNLIEKLSGYHKDKK